MTTTFELNAELREAGSSNVSRRLRRTGKIPAVLYGAGRDPVSISLDHNQIMHSLKNEAFHTSILTVRAGKEEQQAILRDVQMHPFRAEILHVDLQRISGSETIHMKVPVHFIGEDVAPGVKNEGGLLSHLLNDVDVTCLPSQLPEYLEADCAQLHLHDSVHLSDLKLPEGVSITSLAHGGEDLAVASVSMVREVVEEEEVVEGVEGEAVAEAAEDTDEAAATPASEEDNG